MPDLYVKSIGQGGDTLQRLINPSLLFVADIGSGRDWAQVQKYAILITIPSESDSYDEVTHIGVTIGVLISDFGEGVDSIFLGVSPLALLIGVESYSDSLDLATILAVMNDLYVSDIGEGTDVADLIPPIPVIREATPEEVPGTINLVRNPSVEFDTMDWAVTSPLVGTRIEGGWVGDYGYEVEIPAGSGTEEVVISSYPQLNNASGQPYAASIHVTGDFVAVLGMFLRFYYDDASVGIDIYAEPMVVPEAEGVISFVGTPSPTKTVDRVDMVLYIDVEATDQLIVLDGAQIEPGVGVTPYADGDQGVYHYWYGAPHMSVSYREPAPRVGGM